MRLAANETAFIYIISRFIRALVAGSYSLRLDNCRLERTFLGAGWLPLCYTTSFTLQLANSYCQLLGYARTSNYYSNHTIAQ